MEHAGRDVKGNRSRRMPGARAVGLAGREADAKICSGRAPLTLASTHVELDAGMNQSGHGVGVSVGHGTDRLFGGGTVLAHSTDETGDVYMIAGTLGTDQPLSPDNRFHVCPIITIGYLSDSDAAFRRRLRAVACRGCLDARHQRAAAASGPAIGLDFRKNVGRAASFFAQDGEADYHTFTGGVGFLIWNRLSVIPRVVIPFGSISQTGFQVTVGTTYRASK